MAQKPCRWWDKLPSSTGYFLAGISGWTINYVWEPPCFTTLAQRYSAMRSEYLGMSWLCPFGILCRRSWRNCLQQLCPGGKPGFRVDRWRWRNEVARLNGGFWGVISQINWTRWAFFDGKTSLIFFSLSESSREFLSVRGVRKTHQKKKRYQMRTCIIRWFSSPKTNVSTGKMMVGRRSFPFETCHYLGCGFKYFLFSPLFGEDSQFK